MALLRLVRDDGDCQLAAGLKLELLETIIARVYLRTFAQYHAKLGEVFVSLCLFPSFFHRLSYLKANTE